MKVVIWKYSPWTARKLGFRSRVLWEESNALLNCRTDRASKQHCITVRRVRLCSPFISDLLYNLPNEVCKIMIHKWTVLVYCKLNRSGYYSDAWGAQLALQASNCRLSWRQVMAVRAAFWASREFKLNDLHREKNTDFLRFAVIIKFWMGSYLVSPDCGINFGAPQLHVSALWDRGPAVHVRAFSQVLL